MFNNLVSIYGSVGQNDSSWGAKGHAKTEVSLASILAAAKEEATKIPFFAPSVTARPSKNNGRPTWRGKMSEIAATFGFGSK